MSTYTPPEITTRAEFNRALTGLLRSAEENDVPVEGGYACRTEVQGPLWDVVVAEVRKQDGR